MNNSSDSSSLIRTAVPDPLQFSRWGDASVGAFLALTSILGIFGNSVAFIFFSRSSKRADSKCLYFNRIYILITLTDVLICIAQVPAIEASFSSNRNAVLFSHNAFCEMWGFLFHTTLALGSILLVGLLSTSRVLVLRFPYMPMRPWFVWFAVAVFFFFNLAAFLATVHSADVHITYHPRWMSCGLSMYPSDPPPTFIIDHHRLILWIITVGLESVLPGVLTFCLITLSFFASVMILTNETRQNCVSRRRHQATKTITIISLVYVIFNIPFVLLAGGALGKKIGVSLTMTEPLTLAQFLETNSSGNGFVDGYGVFLVMTASVAVNSALNPVIYLWRMSRFRGFIRCSVKGLKLRRETPEKSVSPAMS